MSEFTKQGFFKKFNCLSLFSAHDTFSKICSQQANPPEGAGGVPQAVGHREASKAVESGGRELTRTQSQHFSEHFACVVLILTVTLRDRSQCPHFMKEGAEGWLNSWPVVPQLISATAEL